MAQRHSAVTSTSARLGIQSFSKAQVFVDYAWLTSGPGRSTASPVFLCALYLKCFMPEAFLHQWHGIHLKRPHFTFFQFKFKFELE